MRVLILGGGYAGLRTALDLGALRRKGQLPEAVRVDLVERAPCHEVVVWMHQVAAGTLAPEQACIDYGDLPLDGVDLHQAAVESLHPGSRRVDTDIGPFSYDLLVVALGSLPTAPEIPGLAEQAHTLRDRAGAETLHDALESAFARAAPHPDRDTRRRLLTTVVAGGGYTGCQLAGELAHRLPDLADRHGAPLDDVRLILSESRDRLLPEMDACHGRAARRILERKGVEVRLAAPLERITEDTVVLGGTGAPHGVLVWAGGMRAPEFLREAGLGVNRQGRMIVDGGLCCPDHPDILAAGDCAVRKEPDGGETATPATAMEAMYQGRYLAALIRDRVRGRSPLTAYMPNRLGLLVSLGDGDAVGNVGPIPMQGRAAGLIKNGAERTYPDTLLRPHAEPFLSPDFLRPV
ncbi:NAD(P)/FAD-dependent oxidoreductase [Thiohalorhabdus sp. Cl-TMA]|uniref:NAD(P)/FAD-dependent oxidoreductase n=1 Tax=Thiohalorhabdus methylotrophus TaxID=3242694 RepID=A0ABV4TYL9_9GAMM